MLATWAESLFPSEYIIDLMEAPGALILAELPSNLEDSRADALSSSTSVGIANNSFLALDMIDLHSEDKSGILGVSSLFPQGAPKVGGSEPNEASSVGNHLLEKDVNPVEKKQTEVFEHEFGKLLPSLCKPSEGLSGTKGKASSAQKMEVKGVSKYVLSATGNPEFAQKLHDVLLESGAKKIPAKKAAREKKLSTMVFCFFLMNGWYWKLFTDADSVVLEFVKFQTTCVNLTKGGIS